MDDQEHDVSAALECVQLGLDAYEALQPETQAALPVIGMMLHWDKSQLESAL